MTNDDPQSAIAPSTQPSGMYAASPHQPEIIAIPPGPVKMFYLRDDEIDDLSSSAFGAVSLALCTMAIGLFAAFLIVLQTVEPLSDRVHAEFLALLYATGFTAALSGTFAVIDLRRVEKKKNEIRRRANRHG